VAEGPIPKIWSEATPAVVWGVLIFASGFEFIACLVHAEWWSGAASFALLVIMTVALIHWRQITRWGPLAYALATLLVVISVWSSLLDQVLPQTHQENQPLVVTEFETQKSTLIEWLQQTQRERDDARRDRDQLQKQVEGRQSRPPMLSYPTLKDTVKTPTPNPEVCADLLRQLNAPPAVPQKHEWYVLGQDQEKVEIRSVMKNLGCFAPEK
jgi:hypothetical protein